MREITQTNYTLEQVEDSSWMRVVKDSKQEALVANSEAGLQFVWRELGANRETFCTTNECGIVFLVNKIRNEI